MFKFAVPTISVTINEYAKKNGIKANASMNKAALVKILK